jgi:hypothetical protein
MSFIDFLLWSHSYVDLFIYIFAKIVPEGDRMGYGSFCDLALE